MISTLRAAFAAASPRVSPRPLRFVGVAIHLLVLALLVAAIARAFGPDDIWAWSTGVFYIAYDVAMLALIAWHTRGLWHAPAVARVDAARPTLSVMIAAHDEALHLPATLDALLAQSDPADAILIVDDGSGDDTLAMLAARYGVALDGRSEAHPSLRVIALATRGGKARALNAALIEAQSDIVVTLDADTILDRDALRHMRSAFAENAKLVAAGGVIAPFCTGGVFATAMQAFQTYEYIRNVVARFAWTDFNGLVLISGAFAGFRRDALLRVGGFDPDILVEDYEVTHRLHRHRNEHGLDWTLGMAGRARAHTESPSRLLLFLRQRRRWFAGHLQTQFANIDAAGNRVFQGFGAKMLVIKTIDTFQPMFGLASVIVLPALIVSGRTAALPVIAALIAAKIVVDLLSSIWIVRLYRRLTGDHEAGRTMPTIAAIVADYFSFMPLRQIGAAWGWLAVLRGRPQWGLRVREASSDEPQRSVE